MCGIMGYLGPQEAAPILIDGLRRLEYRGYDSAGIAVHDGDDLAVAKAEGKLDRLVGQLDGGEGHSSDSGLQLDSDRVLVRVVGYGGVP